MIKPEVILLIRLFVWALMSILFIQSAMDKIMNYSENKNWLISYFSKSIFKGQTSLLLLSLTILESAAGALSLIAIFMGKNIANPLGFYALFLCCVCFLALFLGQRIAKDYAGAANIPGYFMVCLIGLLTYLI